MKILKTFENWKNNIIDDDLFSSGKAKYNPTVSAGVIKYKSGNSEPYYHAQIHKKGTFFICNIYKKTTDGENIRLRHKKKNDLKSAHNYVREFINQRLKRDKNRKKDKNTDSLILPNKHEYLKKDKIFNDDYTDNTKFDAYSSPIMEPPKGRTIIRRY